MATLNDLGRQHTDLGPEQLDCLRRLSVTWGMLADLCFADLQLFLPATPRQGTNEDRFVVGGHVRPATAQTLYRDDQVGRFVTGSARPLVARAFRDGEVHRETVALELIEQPVAVVAVPVRFDGEVIAVLTSEGADRARANSELEQNYRRVFESFVTMLRQGAFPYQTDELDMQTTRVGDGAIVLDRDGRVTFTSPNAVSALHRMGFHMNAVGRHLDDLGFHSDALRTAFSLKVPVTDDVERGTATTIHARMLPLVIDDGVVGALVLLRDISDLRQQERRLVSMDATIREIHHRVKNNLQTVSSLMRLQGRRVDQPEAKAAIDESVRRIRSIALVHEILAQDGGDDVRFTEIVRPITAMVEEALVSPDRPVTFHLMGAGPTLPANVASSMAVVLTELLQNAVEHGYPSGSSGGRVTIELQSSGNEFVVRVLDDGVGLPEGFDLERSDGLGLTIARTLATGDLGGRLTLRNGARSDERSGGHGATAELRVRLDLD